ncbi:arsenite methyltransferase [Actinomadura sp. 6N118]|uniref:arsenite methyltransferase n=1 Tax=Actinomadura sp. 6N118 TaxID=3375151 RepID=UPI00378BFD44
MNDEHDIREQVRDRYASAALNVLNGSQDACCGTATFGPGLYTSDQHDELPDEAVAASLGCGNPLAVADLHEGEAVLDLGSGGGIDVLLSARRVGPSGKAYGLDMTDEMLELARANAAKAQVTNVEFLKGTIEVIPLPDDSVDVVISNCVINLSPDKPAVFTQTYRTLKPGGRIGITDVVAEDHLTHQERAARGSHTECIAGALTTTEYRTHLIAAGFIDIQITRTHQVADQMHSAIIRATKPAAPDGVTIRPMRATDEDQVLAIYQAGLDTGDAGFETTAPTWQDFTDTRLPAHRYVAADTATGHVLGWIAATKVSGRCVYNGVVEHSVYVHPGTQTHGIGTALLNAFIASTEAAGIWTIQSGVFPENTASLRLHEHAGFRTVGTRHRLAQHHGRWRDVILLERRSPTTGT